MSNEELEQLCQLYDKFLTEAVRVARIFQNDKKTDGRSLYADNFGIVDDEVWYEGDVQCYGEWEHIEGYFPLSYLTMSDEELTRLVEERNKEYQRAKDEEEKKRKASEREMKVRKFNELKKELGL